MHFHNAAFHSSRSIRSNKIVVRKWHSTFIYSIIGGRQRYSVEVIRRNMKTFERELSLQNNKPPNRQRNRLRREFADWAFDHLEHDPDFAQKLLSNETYFWLNSFRKKQNSCSAAFRKIHRLVRLMI